MVLDDEDVNGDEQDLMDHWWMILVIIAILVGILIYLRSGSKNDGVEELDISLMMGNESMGIIRGSLAQKRQVERAKAAGLVRRVGSFLAQGRHQKLP